MSNFAGDPVCLLDIRGLLLRRFHGASGGEKGSAKAGLQEFLERDLEEILEIYPPRNILACWDRGNDYRRKLYPAYKQARRDKESSPEEKAEINDLFSMSKNVLRALGVKSVSVPGVGPAGWESLVEFVGLDGMDELKGIIERKDRASLEEAVHASDHKVLSKLLSGWEAWTVSHTLAKLHAE